MATPYSNSVAITDLSFSGLSNDEAALIDGAKWGGGYGTGVDLTYSFPWVEESPSHVEGYGGYEEEWPGSFALNENERSAVVQALDVISRSANISFTELPDNDSVVGELRFTSSNSISSFAHAYVPESGRTESGDVWFSPDWNEFGEAITRGSYDFLAIIHEIGHALGLKHSFDPGYSGEVLPDVYDNYLYTVMSYTAGPGMDESVYADFYPTTMMYLDLAALETLYGPSLVANTGNTNYVFHDNQTYWQTIADSSGIDTITYVSSSRGGLIDLSNADFSHMGRPVHFDNGTSTRDTIGLGPSTLIENAAGGNGNDTLIGNYVANQLTGNVGNDTLNGGGGNDTLNGGGGGDRITGGTGDDRLVGGNGADRLQGGNGNDTLIWHAADGSVNGGAGTDTLKLSSGDLNLRAVANSRIVDIERINLAGAGENTLTLGLGDLLDISSTSNTLRVLGGAGDTVDITASFTQLGDVMGFTRYKNGAGVLWIDSDIAVV